MKTLIVAALLLAHAVPAHAEWFLILDAWTCSTRSCADPGSGYEDYVMKNTYATRAICLSTGRAAAKLYATDQYGWDDDYASNLIHNLADARELAGGLPVAGFHPRCERHR